MERIIIAVDPGLTIGVALRLPDGRLRTLTCDKPEQLYDFLSLKTTGFVIYETFQAQTISKYGLHTVRVVGGIEALCYTLKLNSRAQTPHMRRPFLQDAREQLENKAVVVHEIDATAHLLRYEYDRKEGLV